MHVKGAKPGDVLQVDILSVKVRQDWGFVSILPLLGTLADEFTDYETIHPKVDRSASTKISTTLPSRRFARWSSTCATVPTCRATTYMLCSLVGNLRVTQLVDGNKGIHMLLPKAYL